MNEDKSLEEQGYKKAAKAIDQGFLNWLKNQDKEKKKEASNQ